jgi:benzoyl-CoA reductase/2-hydroxyglutaryl-CoA dehydratase subunit BcrC/BadD/HgdB
MELKPYEIIESVIAGARLGTKVLDSPHLAWLGVKAAAPLLFHREHRLNRAGRFGFQKIGSSRWSPGELAAYKHDCIATLAFFQRVLDARDGREPLVWLGWPVPIEVASGFDDVAAFVPEAFMAIANMVGTDGHVACLEAVEREGISDDICAMDRISLGAYLLEQIPTPAAIVSVAHPCDASRTTSQLMEYISGAPAYTIDTAYTKEDADVALYSKNLFEAIAFLEDTLGRKYNWDKFRRMVAVLNEQNRYLNEITHMNQSIPSAGLSLGLQTAWGSKITGAGNPELVKSAKAMYNVGRFRLRYPQLRRKVEKFRIIVADMPIVFSEMSMWIEKTFGGVVVGDYIGDAIFPEIDCSSLETMMMGVARDRLYMGMVKQAHGAARETVDDLERQIEQFSADCVIQNGHQGCKHNRALQRIVKDVCRRHDIPILIMEADIFDKRVMSEAEIKRELTNFFVANGFAS